MITSPNQFNPLSHSYIPFNHMHKQSPPTISSKNETPVYGLTIEQPILAEPAKEEKEENCISPYNV
jgi:hypothetical protein